MNYLASKINEIAGELIADALENGDALKTAQQLRADIRQGWLTALEDSGMPIEMIKTLQFPL